MKTIPCPFCEGSGTWDDDQCPTMTTPAATPAHVLLGHHWLCGGMVRRRPDGVRWCDRCAATTECGAAVLAENDPLVVVLDKLRELAPDQLRAALLVRDDDGRELAAACEWPHGGK